MRESIGGTWIMGIVVFFIILFSSYLAISVNYSKAFKVKNAIINYIEKNNGHNTSARSQIEDYLRSVGYGVYNDCSKIKKCSGDSNCKDLGGFISNNKGESKYCILKREIPAENATLKTSYYTVTVFFKLDLPVIGSMFMFPIYGETKSLQFAIDN